MITGNPAPSARALLAAGLCTVAVAATIVPATTRLTSAISTSAAIRLSAAVAPLPGPAGADDSAPGADETPILCCSNPTTVPQAVAVTSAGSVIINAYDFVEPWVAYGFELAQWALSFVPVLWWVAPAIDLGYFTVEPIVQSLVYSFAYLIDGDIAAIGPTIGAGIQEAATNFVDFAIAWLYSIVPLPPWPPFVPIPPFVGAAVSPPAQSVGRAAAVAAPAAADAEQTPAQIESAATEPVVAVTAPRAGKGSAVRGSARDAAGPAAAASIDEVSDGTGEPAARPAGEGRGAARTASRAGR